MTPHPWHTKIIVGMITAHASTFIRLIGKARISTSTFSPATVIIRSRTITTRRDTNPTMKSWDMGRVMANVNRIVLFDLFDCTYCIGQMTFTWPLWTFCTKNRQWTFERVVGTIYGHTAHLQMYRSNMYRWPVLSITTESYSSMRRESSNRWWPSFICRMRYLGSDWLVKGLYKHLPKAIYIYSVVIDSEEIQIQ